VLFGPRPQYGVFGEVVAAAKLTQLRLAETEKYAHVTYFFNGGREDVFPAKTASWFRRTAAWRPTIWHRRCRRPTSPPPRSKTSRTGVMTSS